jgi:hypothetical protein
MPEACLARGPSTGSGRTGGRVSHRVRGLAPHQNSVLMRDDPATRGHDESRRIGIPASSGLGRTASRETPLPGLSSPAYEIECRRRVLLAKGPSTGPDKAGIPMRQDSGLTDGRVGHRAKCLGARSNRILMRDDPASHVHGESRHIGTSALSLLVEPRPTKHRCLDIHVPHTTRPNAGYVYCSREGFRQASK